MKPFFTEVDVNHLTNTPWCTMISAGPSLRFEWAQALQSINIRGSSRVSDPLRIETGSTTTLPITGARCLTLTSTDRSRPTRVLRVGWIRPKWTRVKGLRALVTKRITYLPKVRLNRRTSLRVNRESFRFDLFSNSLNLKREHPCFADIESHFRTGN